MKFLWRHSRRRNVETGRRLLCYCLLYGEYYLCIFIRLRRILFGELFWKKIKKVLAISVH